MPVPIAMAPPASGSQAATGHQQKRRKLRKGTQSCWECKRRKMRCIFPSSTSAVCSACQRRGSACVSQEIEVEPPPAPSGQHLGRRLERVEALLGRVLDRPAGVDKTLTNEGQHINDRAVGALVSRHQAEHIIHGSPADRRIEGVHPAIDLDRALRASWPDQDVMEAISKLTVDSTAFYHIAHCLRHSPTLPDPSGTLHMPSPGSQPVLVAKSLLLLAIYLLCTRPRASELRHVEFRAVETARHLVTTRDELVDSLAGLECIMLETCYENYSGNLRRSWSAVRRAMTTAQMLGIHKTRPSASLVPKAPEYLLSSDQIWLRIVGMDRYLCLMLGLPPGSHDEYDTMTISSPELLSLPPAERMLRCQAITAWRILQRRDPSDLEATASTDELLQHVTGLVPAQWWLIPCISNADVSAPTATNLANLERMLSQLTHYHMLVQLHLPYVLRSTPESFYNKLTAVNACREVLTRFLVVRSSATPGNEPRMSSSFCRGVDFVAFTSCTVLCLAHMTSRRNSQGESTISRVLSHQRCSDLALIERTAESLQQAAAADQHDAIASTLVATLEPLLRIAADVMTGEKEYSAASTTAHETDSAEEIGCGGNVDDGGDVLRVRLPLFGVIEIRQTCANELETDWWDSLPFWWDPSTPSFSQMPGLHYTEPVMEGEHNWHI